MRRLRWLLLLAPVALSAQAPLKAFRAASDVSMRIWLPAGTLRVEVWDRDSIQVRGTVARGGHLYAGGSGPSAKIGVDWDDHTRTDTPHGDLVVTVPRKAHVWVKMTDGDVDVTGTAGEVEVITVTGQIGVHKAQGVVSVETIDAGIVLEQDSGEIRVRSGGGQVMLSRLFGTISVATVGANVWLEGPAIPDTRIETISGAITVSGAVAHNALVDLETHSGKVTLSFGGSPVPGLALTSRAGTVRNPVGNGSAAFGKIIAYSFKGDINVIPAKGIEAKKTNTPP